MRKILIFLTLFLCFGYISPKAKAADTDVTKLDNTIYCESQDVTAGETVTLSLSMKNDKVITGYQVDIELPEGYEFVTEYGFYVADISTARKVSTRTHSFDAEMQDDGSLRILCYSSKNFPFSGSDGEVATFAVRVTENAPAGASTVRLKNIIMTESSGVVTKSPEVTFSLTLPEEESLEDYDLDKDGHVNIADVTKLVNFILKHPELK